MNYAIHLCKTILTAIAAVLLFVFPSAANGQSFTATDGFDVPARVFGGAMSGSGWANNSWIREGENSSEFIVISQSTMTPILRFDQCDFEPNFLQLSNNNTGAYRLINLSTAISATLTFKYDYHQLVDDNDYILVQIDPENDGNYITLETITSTGNSPDPASTVSISIPEEYLGGSATRIKITTGSELHHLTSEYWWIDDVEVAVIGMDVDATVTDESCPGANNGAINLTVSGGDAPYTYEYELSSASGVTTGSGLSITGLAAGTYKVGVTDANDVKAYYNDSLIVRNSGSISLSLNATYLSGSGTSDGAIDLTVNGGAANYTYAWTKDGNSYASTEDLAGLSAGTYAVTVTDACNQTATSSVIMEFKGNLDVVQKYLYLTGPDQGLDRIDPANAGTTDNTKSTTAPLKHSPVEYKSILDQFNTVAYNGDNSTGSLKWDGDWIEMNDDNSASSGKIRVVSSGLRFEFVKHTQKKGFIYRDADLSNVPTAKLKFEVSKKNLHSGKTNEIGVEVSYNDGDYNHLGVINYNSVVEGGSYSYDLIAGKAKTRIRFIFNDHDHNNHIILDDIAIEYPLPRTPGKETFTQTPAMCSPLTIPAAETIRVETFATVTSGSMPSNPDITATLQYGATPTHIITLNNPTWDNSKLIWTGTLPSEITIPTGASIVMEITNNEIGVAFTIDYDSATNPSKIQLPTSTYINIDAYDFYDDSFVNGGGSIINPEEGVVGKTVYLRTTVSDPFGAYDITGLDFIITGPNASSTTVAATQVASAGCNKTYEYAWTVPATSGEYSLQAIAHEGSEGVTHKETKTFKGLVRYVITNPHIYQRVIK